MAETISIFDSYQKKGLLPSLGGSDEIYMKLKQSAEDISGQLAETPSKIIPYVLVAIDNNISEEEPVLEEVENSIIPNWQLVRSQFPQMPVALYRIIILQALETLVQNDPSYAAIIWLTASDLFRYLQIAHKEESVLKAFLHRLGDIAEEEAIKEWTITESDINVSVPQVGLKLIKASAKTDNKALEDFMIAASGPSGEDGKVRTNPNPHWPNSAQAWSYQFAPRAAKGIVSVVDTALVQLGESIDKNSGSIQKTINDYFVVVGKNLEQAFQAALQSSIAVERRSQLLWWKESLYSRTLHNSYRQLSRFQCAIAMAFDLFEMLPPVFPVSVEFILREAFGQIHGFEGNQVPLDGFFKEVMNPGNKEFLTHYYKAQSISEGRIDLDTFITKVLFTYVDVEKEYTSALGVTPDRVVAYDDMSVWVLHCLSAKRLTQ